MLIVAMATCGVADIMFDLETWSDADDTEGWDDRDDIATVQQQTTGGNPDGYLNMHFDESIGAGETEAMVAPITGYTGDYTSYDDLSVEFDYLGYSSSDQWLYFDSDYNGGSTWAYLLEPTVAYDWEHWTINFYDQTGWLEVGSSGNSWLDALTQVSLIGVVVDHTNIGAMDYGLDNWQFQQVPEPGEIALAVTALGGMLLFFRRKKEKEDPQPDSA